jgi:hypothetical protein
LWYKYQAPDQTALDEVVQAVNVLSLQLDPGSKEGVLTGGVPGGMGPAENAGPFVQILYTVVSLGGILMARGPSGKGSKVPKEPGKVRQFMGELVEKFSGKKPLWSMTVPELEGKLLSAQGLLDANRYQGQMASWLAGGKAGADELIQQLEAKMLTKDAIMRALAGTTHSSQTAEVKALLKAYRDISKYSARLASLGEMSGAEAALHEARLEVMNLALKLFE